ncbi:MAG: hypothetical protein EKK42_20345 [Pseudonocardiaceae bacterium]|nr:MAG: hypothetical protein EKK42_20345 [Pseudonocardiaceae bacterium]
MIDINWLLVLTAFVVPMLTALVTKQVSHSGVKAAVLAALSAVGGVLTEIQSVSGDLSAMSWNASLANAVGVFLAGVGLHYGLLRPVGITGSTGAIQEKVPGGI